MAFNHFTPIIYFCAPNKPEVFWHFGGKGGGGGYRNEAYREIG